MKHTIKTYLKLFILFLGSSFLLINCEQKNSIFPEENIVEKNNYWYKKIVVLKEGILPFF